MEEISEKVSSIDLEGCDISMGEALEMVVFLQNKLHTLKTKLLESGFINEMEEIYFFKEMKPQILSQLLYFNKIYTIELKRPNGSNISQKNYYEQELNSLTFFFNRNLDFYEYYRSNGVDLDEYYFRRGKPNIRLGIDSSHFINDADFSTGYDYKVAKILSNEMLRIFLNKKLQYVDRLSFYFNNHKQTNRRNKWSGTKAAAIELGYALYAAKVLDNGNADIREIMTGLQSLFNIDLGDYYRSYIAIKSRKKDRTSFLRYLADCLEKRMDEEFGT
ncbi:MAG: RteC domain-containing protein [Paludibacteraceae bacterium]